MKWPTAEAKALHACAVRLNYEELMTEENAVPSIYPNDSTKALLGFAMAIIHEIKHHQGYSEERFVSTLKSIASGLKPETPGLTYLMETFEKMATHNIIFESQDGPADNT